MLLSRDAPPGSRKARPLLNGGVRAVHLLWVDYRLRGWLPASYGDRLAGGSRRRAPSRPPACEVSGSLLRKEV